MDKTIPTLFLQVVRPLNLVGLLLACLFADQACGQSVKDDVQGWRDSRWGMTEDEVLKAFSGEAKKLEKADKYGNSTFASIGIDDVEIGTSHFQARFLFDNQTKKLQQVNLQMISGSGNSDVYFPSIEQRLTEKYGKPDFISNGANQQKLNGDLELQRSWKRGTTRIELSLSQMKNIKFDNFLIIYKVIPESGDKNL